jgi:hypothetical protein
MCRYHKIYPYKTHFACLDCRLTFKEYDFIKKICPNCGKDMVDMGFDFQAPRKESVQQWKKLKLLHLHKVHFHSCGCTGPGYRPKNYQEAKRLLG